MSIWNRGSYEHTAARLEPAADVVVSAVGPQPGARVLDVACGTGNAALVAARAGARAVGVDSAARLLDVARERAGAEGLDAQFVEAEATAMPFKAATFDAAVSAFGVIFAEPAPAAAELLRVVRPGGRIALTTWVPGGPINRAVEIVREALGGPPQPARWSSEAFVRELFAPHEVILARHGLAFSAPSPGAYVDEQFAHHPMWLAALPALEKAGRRDEVVEQVTAVMTESNEDPSAFRATSEYDVVTVVV